MTDNVELLLLHALQSVTIKLSKNYKDFGHECYTKTINSNALKYVLFVKK